MAQHDCEQATVDLTRYYAEEPTLIAFNPCDGTATHNVRWCDNDGESEMWMCDTHMAEFLADAEYMEGVKWTYCRPAEEMDLASAS